MSGVTSTLTPLSPLLLSAPFLPRSNSLLNPSSVAVKSAAATPLTPQHHLRLRCSKRSDAQLAMSSGERRGTGLLCCCSPNSTDSPSGENESKSILDAFFLGKALAEVLNERVESAVGEILSTIGKLQSEQQKQIQSFQEDVVERAKKAKQGAARTTAIVDTSSTDDPETYASSTTDEPGATPTNIVG